MVSISSTESCILDWVLATVGAGKITRKRVVSSRHAPGLTYSISNRQALSILEQVAPYLRSYKRRRAQLVLATLPDSDAEKWQVFRRCVPSCGMPSSAPSCKSTLANTPLAHQHRSPLMPVLIPLAPVLMLESGPADSEATLSPAAIDVRLRGRRQRSNSTGVAMPSTITRSIAVVAISTAAATLPRSGVGQGTPKAGRQVADFSGLDRRRHVLRHVHGSRHDERDTGLDDGRWQRQSEGGIRLHRDRRRRSLDGCHALHQPQHEPR